MRSPFALTIITFLLLVSLGNAQSDAPPPSRLLRRNQSETPPPSRPLGKVTDEASSSKAPSKVAPFPQPVLAPPASSPVVKPKEIAVPVPLKSINQPKLTAPAFPNSVAPAFPKKIESVELSKPLFPPEITEQELIVSPPKLNSSIPRGQKGTWVAVEEGKTTVVEEAVIQEETVTEPAPLKFPALPPLPLTTQIETISSDGSSPPAMAPPPPIEETLSKVDQQPIEGLPNELPFYDQGYVCENCQNPECSTENACYDYDEISPVVLFGVKGGSDRTITDIRAFLPIWRDDLEVLFGDIRGRFDDEEANEGQFGIGYRTLLSPDWIFGVYGYYDLRKTNQRNRFNQFTTGIEFLSEEWDVRLNGYFPNEGGKNSNLWSGISNGTIVSNAFEERAARGMNFEVGKRILHWGRFDAQEVRWFVGYYRYDNDASGFNRISGPSTRLEFRSYDLPFLANQSRLTAGVEYTTDDIRDDQTWAFLRVQIPLAPQTNRKRLNPLRRRFVDMPVRNID